MENITSSYVDRMNCSQVVDSVVAELRYLGHMGAKMSNIHLLRGLNVLLVLHEFSKGSLSFPSSNQTIKLT